MTLCKTLLLPFLLLAAGIAPGWLGVFLGESEDGRPAVTEVVADSPADKAGVRAGDVLLAIDGQELTTVEGVVEAVGGKEAGSKVKLTVRRDGKNQVIEVKLGTRPADAEAARSRSEETEQAEKARLDAERAAKAAAAEKAKAEKAKAEAAEKAKEREHAEKPHTGGRPFLGVALEAADAGVRIGEVLADSPAAKAGLTAGSVIAAIGDAKISSLDDIDAAMTRLRAGQKITIQVRSDGKTRSVDVVLGSAPGEARDRAPESVAKPGPDRIVVREQAAPRKAAAVEASARGDVGSALRAARGKQPVLLVFGADWDSGTKALRRSLDDERVKKALHDVAVIWVDTDRDGRIADEFNVQQIPHLVGLDPQGKKLGAIEGYQPPEVLVERFDAMRAKAMAARGAASQAAPTRVIEVARPPIAEAKPEAKTRPEPKPEAKAKSGERDLENEVRALREEIRALREVLRELVKEKGKDGESRR